jgi:hypothetical protein
VITKKFVLVSEGKAFLVFNLDESNLEHQALSAGFISDPTFMEIEPEIPAFIGWSYNGVDFIKPDGEVYGA